MDISTSLNVFEAGYPIERAIQRCKDAGFHSLDFNYWDYQEHVLQMSWEEEQAWAQKIRSSAEAVGVQFTQMHGPVHGRAFGQMVMGLNVESFLVLSEKALQTAAILGVPWVVFHPGLLSQGGEEPYKEVVDFNCKFFSRLIPVMESTGVGIALENLCDRTSAGLDNSKRNYCALPDELVELIGRVNHPLVGACWDTGHGHRQGLRQATAIRTLGKSLKTLHIQDNDGMLDQHLLPYQGTVDWNEVVETLNEIGYKGDFTYEAHRSIRHLPDELRDAALVYAAALGRFLIRNQN